MKKCDSNKSIERKNSDRCIISEFPICDRDINFTIAKISARYPDTGFATNTKCKEIVFVHKGSGIAIFLFMLRQIWRLVMKNILKIACIVVGLSVGVVAMGAVSNNLPIIKIVYDTQSPSPNRVGPIHISPYIVHADHCKPYSNFPAITRKGTFLIWNLNIAQGTYCTPAHNRKWIKSGGGLRVGVMVRDTGQHVYCPTTKIKAGAGTIIINITKLTQIKTDDGLTPNGPQYKLGAITCVADQST